jgi:hypothetical protein
MNFDMRAIALEKLSHYLSMHIQNIKMEDICDLAIHFSMNVTMSQ